MNFLPGSSLFEKQLKIPIFFTIVILYQGLVSGKAFETPKLLKEKMKEPLFRFLSLSLVAISATRDLETAVIGLTIFLALLYMIRTEEEKEKLGTFLGFKGVV